jgi:hypothetical protein
VRAIEFSGGGRRPSHGLRITGSRPRRRPGLEPGALPLRPSGRPRRRGERFPRLAGPTPRRSSTASTRAASLRSLGDPHFATTGLGRPRATPRRSTLRLRRRRPLAAVRCRRSPTPSAPRQAAECLPAGRQASDGSAPLRAPARFRHPVAGRDAVRPAASPRSRSPCFRGAGPPRDVPPRRALSSARRGGPGRRRRPPSSTISLCRRHRRRREGPRHVDSDAAGCSSSQAARRARVLPSLPAAPPPRLRRLYVGSGAVREPAALELRTPGGELYAGPRSTPPRPRLFRASPLRACGNAAGMLSRRRFLGRPPPGSGPRPGRPATVLVRQVGLLSGGRAPGATTASIPPPPTAPRAPAAP